MSEFLVEVTGTGAIGRTHIEHINNKISGAKMIVCTDINVVFCKLIAERYDITAYGTGEALIEKAGVDAIVVPTSDAFREQYVIAAIKARKYVFVRSLLLPPPRRTSASLRTN